MRRGNFAELLDALERAGPGGGEPAAGATPARQRRAFVVESSANNAERAPPPAGGFAGPYLNEPLLADDVDALIAVQAWGCR